MDFRNEWMEQKKGAKINLKRTKKPLKIVENRVKSAKSPSNVIKKCPTFCKHSVTKRLKSAKIDEKTQKTDQKLQKNIEK